MRRRSAPIQPLELWRLEPAHEATGIVYAELVDRIIRHALARASRSKVAARARPRQPI
jgi:hypothetical protein